MKGEQVRLWAKACEELGTDIWPLKTHGDDGLYMTKKPYMVGHREYWTTPVYQVWIGDKRQVTMVREEAYAIWEAFMKEQPENTLKIVQFCSIQKVMEIPKGWNPKSCPFCGSENGPHFFMYLIRPKVERWGVVCLNCMAVMDKGWCQHPRAALDEWNVRPDSKEAELINMLE